MNRILPKIFKMPGRTIATLAALFAFFLLSGTAHAEPRYIDYLYVEANEGDSSGGHAGIRFDKYTFHFQHEPSGIIRVRRYDSNGFEYSYTKLGNRPIHESRISVTPQTYRALDDAFGELLVIQDAQIAIRDDLQRDVALLEALLQRHRQTAQALPPLPLKGLGYFLSDASATPGQEPQAGAAGRSPAVVSLHDAIEAHYGSGYVARRIELLRQELAAMPLHAAEPVAISRERYPTPFPSDVTRFYERHFALLTLEVLQAGLPLQRGSYWIPTGEKFRLHPADERQLALFLDRQRDDLVRLVSSGREDWALPFVVGMARLAAVSESLSTGKLVLLNLFPDADAENAARRTGGERAYLARMERDLTKVFGKRRSEFFASDATHNEAQYASLERAGNILQELQRAVATGAEMRLRLTDTYPARAARLVEPYPVQSDEATLARELERAREVERRYAAALAGLYAYNLLRRNCVTEIFSVINGTMEKLCRQSGNGGACSAAMVREESVRRLGGYVDAGEGMVFIPVFSARQVNGSYSVVSQEEKLAYRREAVARMREREPALRVFLRESNTVTSTVYDRGPGDSTFLFFTDDTVIFRPIFGAFNLAAGLGQSLWGLVVLPVKGPQPLLSGMRGVVFSLPELVFFSIRKGSMSYVERSAK